MAIPLQLRASLAAGATILLFTPLTAAASGGGGMGGGMPSMPPSMSRPSYDPAVEYHKGVEALKDGKFKDAERDFGNALSVDPKNADTLFMMGMAHAGRGDEKAAAKAYEKSLSIDPQLVPARREYGVTLAKLGETDKAQAQLAMLQAKAASCGASCPQAADLSAAVSSVQAAITPPSAPAAASSGAPAAATAPQLATPQASAPPSSGPPMKMGLLLSDPVAGDLSYVDAVRLINLHRYHEALDALAKARQVFGPHPDVITYTGYVWRKLGDYARAEAYYREALAIDPRHVGATEYYGELMVERGDLAGARRMLARLEADCAFGCVESEDLRRWIEHGPPAS
ncbi:MAG: tetratricopeptide repeat protein [Caulobacteraceae bacterium]|nr:tetratricopeptide repeat protein [Caulobacteraceae bacterium]